MAGEVVVLSECRRMLSQEKGAAIIIESSYLFDLKTWSG